MLGVLKTFVIDLQDEPKALRYIVLGLIFLLIGILEL